MNDQNSILGKINKALSTVLDEEVQVSLETDLRAEEILDLK